MSRRGPSGRARQRAGAAWENTVLDIARRLHWRIASFRSVLVKGRGGESYYATPTQADGKGFPDLVLVRGERILFRELKTDKSKVSAEQREWMIALEAAGADVGVWRPRDLEARVIPELQGRAG